jgi:hypothetical protein
MGTLNTLFGGGGETFQGHFPARPLSQGVSVASRAIVQAIAGAGSLDPRETGFSQVHAGNEQAFAGDAIEQLRSCGGGKVCIEIEGD